MKQLGVIMPVTVVWDNDAKTIIRESLIDPLTISEVIDALNEVLLLLESVNHNVDFILDRTQRHQRMLVSWMMLTRQYLLTLQNRNVNSIIVITPDRLARTLYEAAMRLFPNFTRRTYIVVTLEEAYQKIAELRKPATNVK
ncbi:MAG: hypothetical protein U0528_13180 [Anaerolineae bacterium]